MTRFGRIPNKPYGWKPGDETRTKRQRCSIIAKRALTAAYQEGIDPKTRIMDLLADLRHICDTLGLRFFDLDHAAQENYTEEIGEDRRTRAALKGGQP